MGKKTYLIRHGQSTFNVLFEKTGIDPLHFDAPLSAEGVRQVTCARTAAVNLGGDLVVTSPLTRALQTTMGLFHEQTVPVVVSSILRERLGNSCDVGRTPAVLTAEYPSLDFNHLDDTWWHDGEKDDRGVPVEPEHLLMRRLSEFINWIEARPEQTIAVVGHGTFFHRLTGRHLENCEIQKWNPEL
jgi:broad specificity phosphatase PhoE